jgi:hypothetical protein
MNVSFVYRRQDLIREICRKINYQGRFVWLVVGPKVLIMSSKQTGSSRLRFRMLDVHQRPFDFKHTVAREGRVIELDPKTILVAQPVLRGRRRELLAFLHHHLAEEYRWDYANGNRLSPEEIAVLTHQDDTFDLNTMSVARAVCFYRGLTDLKGRITWKGKKLLERRKIRQ